MAAAKMTSGDQSDRGPSLAARFAARVRSRPPAYDPANDGAAITSLPIVDGLVLLAAACGRDSSAAMLTAALPAQGGIMDPRHAPLALARAGLDATWEPRRAATIVTADLPLLGTTRDGGCVMIDGIRADGQLRVRDARGLFFGEAAQVDALLAGELLLCGHADPIEDDGDDETQARSLSERNPRLWLVGSFLGERRMLAQLVVAAVLLNVCALAIPLYMRAIYDRVVPNLALESLWALSVGITIVLIFEFVFKTVRSAYVEAVGVRVAQAVQHRAMAAFLHARNAKSHSAGGLMTALRDVEGLSLLVPQAVVAFFVDLPFFFLFLVLIGLIGGWTVAAPVLGAGALLIVGLVCNFAVKLASKRASKLMQARQDLAVDLAEGLETIKANQAEGRFLFRWDNVSDHLAIGGKATRKWTELPGTTAGLVVQMVTVLVVVVGVFQIKSGMMTTGALVACTMLTGRAMVPVSSAITMMSKANQSLSQFAGLARILALPAERQVSDPGVRRAAVAGRFGLDTISVTHPNAASPSLANVSLTIAAGEKVALIGKSGSGKTTLLNLLAGLAQPSTGLLTIDGHAMAQYAAAQLRRGIVYAAQDATLFDDSIWENILLGMDEPDEAVVELAIAASGLDTFVSRTVEGFCRKVGPRGSHLSGGQRQSVLLARALIRDPRVLLLDEPTASMDIGTEQAVIHGLRGATRNRTLVVATHRLAVLDIVDRVIWLDGGRVIADRPRDEVLAMLRNPTMRAAA
jgi:ATP-binding cassette subfamily C protein LapB